MKASIRFSGILFPLIFVFILQSYSQDTITYPHIVLKCTSTLYNNSFSDSVTIMFVPDSLAGSAGYSPIQYYQSELNVFTIYNGKNYKIMNYAIDKNDYIEIGILPFIDTLTFYEMTVTEYVNISDSAKVYFIIPADENSYTTLIQAGSVIPLFYAPQMKYDYLAIFSLEYYPPPAAVTGISSIQKNDILFSPIVNGKELQVNYNNPQSKNALLQIFSVTGSEVMKPVSINNGLNILPFDESSGLYLLRLISDNKTFIRKIVIQK